MSKKRTKKKKLRRAGQEIVKCHAVVEENFLAPTELSAKSLPALHVVIKEVLKGTQGGLIHEKLNKQGYSVGLSKTYELIKTSRIEIAKRASKDIDVNFAWVQENLLDLHVTCKEGSTRDDRLRLLVIKELKELWGLDKFIEQAPEKDITPEMVESFEQAFLR